MVIATALMLIVIPAIYFVLKQYALVPKFK